MTMVDLDGMTVGVLCADGVEEVEVTCPRERLAAAGATVRLLSPDGRPVRAYHYIDPGDELRADAGITDVEPDMFGCLVVPGGLGGPDTLRHDDDAIDLIQRFVGLRRPLGVICHGPWVLIDAGVLADHRLTCASQIVADVRNAGATYVDADAHVDRNGGLLVSGRDHDAVEPFADTLVDALRRA